MVSEPESVLMDAEFRNTIVRYDAKFRKTMARYDARCESRFNQILQIQARQESRFDQILAHQESRFDQILAELQALRLQQTRPTTEKYIKTFTPATTSCSPRFTQTVTLTNHTITTTLPPKMAKAPTIPPPTQISTTTTHITPHHTIYDQKNIKEIVNKIVNDQKIVNKIVQLHVLQVAVRDLERFRHQNLPTPTCAAASAAFKHHHTIHCISSIAVTTAVFPLPVFDPGGNGSIEEVRAIGCNLGGVSPGSIQIFALRTRHSKEGGMIRSLLHVLLGFRLEAAHVKMDQV